MGKKIRVMHIIGSLVAGGCERMFLTNIAGLEKRGRVVNMGVVVSSRLELLEGWNGDAKLICPGISPSGSGLHCMPALFHELPRVAWAFLSEGPDIVYIYYIHPLTWALLFFLCRISGKKLIVRKMIESVPGGPDFSPYRLCDCAVTVFPGGAGQLAERGVAPDKIRYIPNGKDPALFRSLLGKAEAKARLGLRPDDFVLGMLCRLDSVKNHRAVIEAMPDLIGKQDMKLVIAGDEHFGTEYGQSLRSLVRRLDLGKKVVFLGHRGDIADVLAAFDIFIHPSLREGCPGVVLEAMCAGLPIIASDAGGSAELLGTAGLIVPRGNDGALSMGLQRLMADARLRASLGRKARLRAKKRFSLDSMLTSYEKLFHELAGASQGMKDL